MALITGTTATNWSGVSLDLIDIQSNFEAFATRFEAALAEILAGQYTINPPNTSTSLSMTLDSGGLLTFTGTGLDLNNPAAVPVVRTFDYSDPATGDIVSLTGTLDFVGREVVTGLTIGFPGTEQTITGNLSVDPVSGAVSGTISQLQVTLGTTDMTVRGSFVLAGDFELRGTMTQITVVSGTDTITMTGLSVPYSALASVTTAADLFTVIGNLMPGNDTITYTNNSSVGMTFNGGGGNDIITINGPNGDTLNGGAGNDQLNGGEGADVLNGGLGTDTLNGGTGDDAMDGGAGNDTYLVNSQSDTVTESLAGAAGGVDLVQSAVDFTLGPNLENLTLTGTDDINGTGNALNNILTGNSGDNVLTGLAGNDRLIGNDGNDTLDGGVGVDTMIGGLGNDLYVRDAATDVITEALNAGTDTVQSSLNYILAANLENLELTGSALTGTGNILNNIITGTSGNNTLSGLAGNDQLIGGAGNDTLNGGLGNDQLDGGLGDDILIGDVGQDTVNGGDGNDTITMLVTAGNVDTIDGGADTDVLVLSGVVGGDGLVVVDLSAADQVVSIAGDSTRDTQEQTGFEGVNGALLGSAMTVTGSDGDNVITGSNGNDAIDGEDGNDTLIGGRGNDTLIGGLGNDVVNGGIGNDSMTGGDGDDTYVIDSLLDVITEAANEGIDTVQINRTVDLNLAPFTEIEHVVLTGTAALNATGDEGNNSLTGNAGANILNGGAGDDTLMGNAGNDTLNGGTGDDAMDGGAGNDTYVVDSQSDTVTESLAGAAGGVDVVQSAVDFTLDAGATNVENLTLTGSALNGTGNALNNILTGNSVDNVLTGLAGNDRLIGNDGNDTLDGGVGVDTMIGGLGNDLYVRDAATDVITEALNAGTDTVQSSLNYILAANLENLELTGAALTGTGNTLNNVLTGTSGNNTLSGLAGNDTLNGGDGNDILNGGVGVDNIQGGAGNDLILLGSTLEFAIGETIDGGADTDTLRYTGAAAATLTLTTLVSNIEQVQIANAAGLTTGLAAINVNAAAVTSNGMTLIGNNGANILTGTGLDDSLIGNAGNDTLNGGVGNDMLNGGLGNDTFGFALGDGQDLVQDNSGTADRVLFQGAINPLDLIISQQASDLRIAIEGTTDQITVQNWFSSTANRTETIQAGNGDILLSTQVDTLIQAMAAFTTNTGVTWEQAAAGSGDQTQYQAIIAANWQSLGA